MMCIFGKGTMCQKVPNQIKSFYFKIEFPEQPTHPESMAAALYFRQYVRHCPLLRECVG